MSLLLPFTVQFPFDHSLGDDRIFLQSPSDIVDLGSDAVDIAQRLARLSRFLGGTKRLLTCYFLSPNEFYRYSRKIVCLVEVALKTLTTANIPPYSSSFSASPFRLHKSAYLDLLRMLYDHRHHVDTALQDRLVRLFQPLAFGSPRAKWAGASGSVATEWSSAASPEGRPGRLATASMQRSLKRPEHKLTTISECDTALMPPPDRFSEPDTKYLSLTPAHDRCSQRLWDPDVVFPASKRRRRRRNSRSEDVDRENYPAEMESPTSFKPRPLSRRFGIYCTGKNTMHRQNERAGRPGGINSFIKE